MRLFLLTASIALLAAAPAAALVKIVTFTGLIRSGTDTTGQFGAKGAKMKGLTYTTTYRYWLGGGLRQKDAVSDVYAGVYGPSSYVSGGITINGVTINLAGNYFGGAATSLSGGEFVSQDDFDTRQNDSASVIVNLVTSAMGTDLALDVAPVAVKLDSTNSGYEYATFRFRDERQLTDARFLFATNATYSVTTGVGVPEPAAWGMMVAGFGLIGGAARRRRVATA